MNILYFGITTLSAWASLVAQMVKNLPAMQEIWLGRSPGGRNGYSLWHRE